MKEYSRSIQQGLHIYIWLILKIDILLSLALSRRKMAKKYKKLTDDLRRDLVRLINQEKCSIKEAARRLDIPYPNAKAVNQIYRNENRTSKKSFRFRLKCVDAGKEV